MYTRICVEGEWKTVCKKTLSVHLTEIPSISPVTGSLGQYEGSALDHAATEAAKVRSSFIFNNRTGGHVDLISGSSIRFDCDKRIRPANRMRSLPNILPPELQKATHKTVTMCKGPTFPIQSYNSIRDVKQKVFDAMHIPIEHQKLLLIGKPLAGSSSPSWLCPLSVADYLGTDVPVPAVYLFSSDSKENLPALARLPSAGHTRRGELRDYLGIVPTPQYLPAGQVWMGELTSKECVLSKVPTCRPSLDGRVTSKECVLSKVPTCRPSLDGRVTSKECVLSKVPTCRPSLDGRVTSKECVLSKVPTCRPSLDGRVTSKECVLSKVPTCRPSLDGRVTSKECVLSKVPTCRPSLDGRVTSKECVLSKVPTCRPSLDGRVTSKECVLSKVPTCRPSLDGRVTSKECVLSKVPTCRPSLDGRVTSKECVLSKVPTCRPSLDGRVTSKECVLSKVPTCRPSLDGRVTSKECVLSKVPTCRPSLDGRVTSKVFILSKVPTCRPSLDGRVTSKECVLSKVPTCRPSLDGRVTSKVFILSKVPTCRPSLHGRMTTKKSVLSKEPLGGSRTCLSEASIRGLLSTKDGLKHYNYQCNTVSFTKNFIKKGRGAHKLYLKNRRELRLNERNTNVEEIQLGLAEASDLCLSPNPERCENSFTLIELLSVGGVGLSLQGCQEEALCKALRTGILQASQEALVLSRPVTKRRHSTRLCKAKAKSTAVQLLDTLMHDCFTEVSMMNVQDHQLLQWAVKLCRWQALKSQSACHVTSVSFAHPHLLRSMRNIKNIGKAHRFHATKAEKDRFNKTS
uniref:Uncharacterized protein n=1 Tax=Timema monikensis TaxID=170555 RepID=A0A7R9EA49_9NEOP|nr:unnamed protein product [Timema monikensis]